MANIAQIEATEILDSRGNPTIEVAVSLSDGSIGIAACPSGASVGTYEAVELRDQDQRRFRGLGVLKAIENIEKIIAPRLIGLDAAKQQNIDRVMIELDGTQNKAKLGANATLAVSMAVCKAAAKSSAMPLFHYIRQFIQRDFPLRIPAPLFNIVNGGKHASNNLDFQEFMIIPATAKPYSEALHIGFTVYNALKDVLRSSNLTTLVGDEGGFGPNVAKNEEALGLVKKAVEATAYRFGADVFMGLDVASNTFLKNQQYTIKDKDMPFSADELITYYQELNKIYHFLYLEDPLGEDDWDAWAKLTATMSQQVIIVGDDLTTTNPYRLQTAMSRKAITGIIIKPNQIGTVIEAIAVAEIAREADLKLIVSHRSGETNDDFIADFAVAISADYVKFGAPARGERIAKYNRLLHIDKQLESL